MRPAILWSAIFIVGVVLGCGGSTEQDVITPSGGGRCQMSLATAGPLPAAGAAVTAQLSAARECLWSARSSADWLQVQPATGQGEAALTLSAAPNPLGRTRTAMLSLNDQQFSVLQDGLPCSFEISPPALNVNHQGGRASLRVATLEGCSWTTSSSHPWVRVVSGSGGDASGSLELAIDSNAGAERSALVTVATAAVAIHQSAGPNDRSECRFSVHPGARTVAAAGETASFSVSTLPGCAWSPISTQPWITIVSGTNLFGANEVVYRVDPNPFPTSRSGVITAGTRNHVIRQEGGPRP